MEHIKDANILKMTLAEVSENIKDFSEVQLLEFYNHYSGNKVKKFRDAQDAYAKTSSLLTFLLKKTGGKPRPKKGATVKKDKILTISKRAGGCLNAVREILADDPKYQVTCEDVADQVNSVQTSVQPHLDQLVKKGLLEASGDDDPIYSLTELGKAFDIPTGSAMTGGIGRKSKFTGSFILATQEDNPRREGTFGYASFAILNTKVPMAFEDYIKAGGRNNDLNWDLDRDWVKILDGPDIKTAKNVGNQLKGNSQLWYAEEKPDDWNYRPRGEKQEVSSPLPTGEKNVTAKPKANGKGKKA